MNTFAVMPGDVTESPFGSLTASANWADRCAALALVGKAYGISDHPRRVALRSEHRALSVIRDAHERIHQASGATAHCTRGREIAALVQRGKRAGRALVTCIRATPDAGAAAATWLFAISDAGRAQPTWLFALPDARPVEATWMFALPDARPVEATSMFALPCARAERAQRSGGMRTSG